MGANSVAASGNSSLKEGSFRSKSPLQPHPIITKFTSSDPSLKKKTEIHQL